MRLFADLYGNNGETSNRGSASRRHSGIDDLVDTSRERDRHADHAPTRRPLRRSAAASSSPASSRGRTRALRARPKVSSRRDGRLDAPRSRRCPRGSRRAERGWSRPVPARTAPRRGRGRPARRRRVRALPSTEHAALVSRFRVLLDRPLVVAPRGVEVAVLVRELAEVAEPAAGRRVLAELEEALEALLEQLLRARPSPSSAAV